MTRTIGAASAILTMVATLAPGTAEACGGFFCNRDQPVDQSAERIVFAVDTESGTVDTHVQIFYQGESEDFAWVLPVPAVPDLFLSSDALFNQLEWQTRPQFNLAYEEWGDCYSGSWYNTMDMMAGSMDPGSPPTDDDRDEDEGVEVISRQTVGPYETVVLQADSSAQLLDWLQANSYDLPDDLDPILAPYVAGEQYFVALRLANDKDSGDIAPVGMRYAGTTPAIPIQLTSVAATPDMRLEVFVFADHRAVPDNYLHVKINEAAVDWLSWGGNYEDVITLAADEAGGHAFATDYSGPTTPFAGLLFQEGRFDVEVIRNATTPEQAMEAIMSQGFPATSTLQNILVAYMPPPDGIDAQSFYNCVSCYDTSGMTPDYQGLADALQEVMVEPLQNAEALFAENTTLSRLTSSMSPLEMTIDPMFVQNADMAPVSNVHEANMILDCRNNRDWYTARRRVELSDGRVILLPSQEWFSDSGTSTSDFFADSTDVNALIIEQTGSSGEPILLTDNSDYADQQLDDHNDIVEDIYTGGCGCSSNPGPAGGLALLLPLLGVLVRRKTQ